MEARFFISLRVLHTLRVFAFQNVFAVYIFSASLHLWGSFILSIV